MGGKVVVRLIGQSSSETSDVDAGMAAGRLFLVKKTADNISWVNCGNVIVPYGWRPSDKHIEHIDAENESDLHAKLPFAAGMSFGAEFEQGNRVRVWIASAGAFHVDEAQVKIPAGCKATHYVSTITVGAIRSSRSARARRRRTQASAAWAEAGTRASASSKAPSKASSTSARTAGRETARPTRAGRRSRSCSPRSIAA